jgi:hypothetical protein
MKLAHLLTVAALATLLAAGQADATGRPFTVALDGASEAPGPGDADGTGTAILTVNPGTGEVSFTITVQNIALPSTGAHIHRAPAGQPGPVVVALTPPDASGASAGTVTGVNRELAVDIIRNPDQYYVNVHNADFPPGAVRGQLGN